MLEPWIVKRLVDYVFVDQDWDELFWYLPPPIVIFSAFSLFLLHFRCCIYLISTPVLKEIVSYAQSTLEKSTQRIIIHKLQLQVYDHIQVRF